MNSSSNSYASSSSGSSRGGSRQASPDQHDYRSPHSSTGKAAVVHRGNVTTFNHGARIKEKGAPTPSYDPRYHR